MGADFGPAAVGDEAVDGLGEAARVDVVVAGHDHRGDGDAFQRLLGHAEGQVGAVEQGVDGVAHHLDEVLGVHGLQVLAVVGVGLRQLGAEGREAVVGVEGVHDRRDAVVLGPVHALEQLGGEVGVADDAAGDVGGEDGAHPLGTADGAAQGDGRPEGAAAEIGPLDAQGVHQAEHVVADHVPSLHHHRAAGLAAEAAVVHHHPMLLGQALDHRLVAAGNPLEAAGRKDDGRSAP